MKFPRCYHSRIFATSICHRNEFHNGNNEKDINQLYIER